MQFLSPPTIDRCKTKCSTFLLKSAKKSIEQQKNLRTPRAEKVLSSPNKLKAKDHFFGHDQILEKHWKRKTIFKIRNCVSKNLNASDTDPMT